VYDAKNITNANVSYPSQGVYCLKGLPQFKSVMATATGAGNPTPGNWDRVANVVYSPDGFSSTACGANTQVIITLYDVGTAIASGGPPAGFAAGDVIVWLED
jgi:hypothetical protein